MDEKKFEYPIKVTQERTVERITFKGLFSDIFKAFNVERGLVYTFKGLITRPGATIQDYLYEGRFVQFHPVRFLLITTAVSFFLFLGLAGSEEMQGALNQGALPEQVDDEQKLKVYNDVFFQMFNDYFNLMIWLFIPVISVFSYMFYRKSTGYNFSENMVANAYITCIGNLINSVFYFLTFVTDITTTSLISLTFYFAYTCFAYVSFFRRGKTWSALLKAFVSLVLGYFFYLMIFSISLGIAVGYKLAQMGILN